MGVSSLQLLLGLLFYTAVVAQEDDNPYRLPREVIPHKYTIHLTLEDKFWESKNFTGTVEIVTEVLKETSMIILHSDGIDYEGSTITLTLEDDEPSQIDFTTQDDLLEEYQQLRLVNNDIFQPGNYSLKFENYTGRLYEDMHGFYLSSYNTTEGNEEYIATTQFQPTHARRAFPCFDEPNFKAVFALSITRPEGYMALANTNSSTDDDNTDTFEDTPIMSSYLLAFIVSKFKGYGDKYDEEKNLYEVWSREEALETAEYSYTVSPKILEQLNTLTGIDYFADMGMEKMHQVAIPDFSAGAMENWGLVTYRETALLWDPNESTVNYLQRVATVIAHEFTHMWFGNLVTLDWWDYTWLNEGFARYYQYFITAKVETDWELEQQFVIEQQQVIFGSDALENAASLNKEANTPEEISSKFISISYNKGASVIRMMINFLGEEKYNSGIQAYLKEYQFKNTIPANLYEQLSNKLEDGDLPYPLADIMESWTTKAGFPVVTVSRNASGLVFKQERFLLDSEATSDFKYYVPITYTTQAKADFTDTTVDGWLTPDINELLIRTDEETEEETDGESEGWVLVNIQETGYYRVNYDEELWDELEAALKAGEVKFPDINRAQIVDDALNLARAGKLSYPRALEITGFLVDETSYYPWYAAFNAFSFLRRRIDSTSVAGEYLTEHILTLMQKLYDSVSFEITSQTSHVNTLKTALALQWACQLGQEHCVEEAIKQFHTYHGGESIDPNIRSTVYCTAVREAEDSEFWDYLWDKFLDTDLATEQITILNALGCSKDETILTNYLQKSISETSGIRKQDANTVFTSVLAGNPENVDVAFTFLNENIDDIAAYYDGMNALSSIITGIADRLTTEDQIDQFEQFVKDNADKLKESVNQAEAAVETARANLKWVNDNMVELNDWLTETYGSAASITLNLTLLLATLAVVVFNFS